MANKRLALKQARNSRLTRMFEYPDSGEMIQYPLTLTQMAKCSKAWRRYVVSTKGETN